MSITPPPPLTLCFGMTSQFDKDILCWVFGCWYLFLILIVYPLQPSSSRTGHYFAGHKLSSCSSYSSYWAMLPWPLNRGFLWYSQSTHLQFFIIRNLNLIILPKLVYQYFNWTDFFLNGITQDMVRKVRNTWTITEITYSWFWILYQKMIYGKNFPLRYLCFWWYGRVT